MKCKYCGGDSSIRNPTLLCDHLYYEERVNKNLQGTHPELSPAQHKEVQRLCKEAYRKGMMRAVEIVKGGYEAYCEGRLSDEYLDTDEMKLIADTQDETAKNITELIAEAIKKEAEGGGNDKTR